MAEKKEYIVKVHFNHGTKHYGFRARIKEGELPSGVIKRRLQFGDIVRTPKTQNQLTIERIIASKKAEDNEREQKIINLKQNIEDVKCAIDIKKEDIKEFESQLKELSEELKTIPPKEEKKVEKKEEKKETKKEDKESIIDKVKNKITGKK